MYIVAWQRLCKLQRSVSWIMLMFHVRSTSLNEEDCSASTNFNHSRDAKGLELTMMVGCVIVSQQLFSYTAQTIHNSCFNL